MKNNINYRLRKLSHGLSSVGIVAVMLGTTVPFSTANVSDNLNPEHVAQAAETNEDYEKTYDIVYLGDIELPFKEQEVKKLSSSTSTDDEIIEVNSKTLSEIEDDKPPVLPKQDETDDKEQSDKEQSDEADKEKSDEQSNDKSDEQSNDKQSDDKQLEKEQSNNGSINIDKKEKNKENFVVIGDKQSNKTDKQTDKQNKDKDIKVEIGEPYMPKELEEQIERSNQEIKQSIEEKQSQSNNQDEPSLNKEDDETIIKENEGEQSPSQRDSNEVTEPVYDSSDVTKEQKQGQPELAETGIQKNNRLALLGIAGIGIVIAGLFFFISRRDKK